MLVGQREFVCSVVVQTLLRDPSKLQALLETNPHPIELLQVSSFLGPFSIFVRCLSLLVHCTFTPFRRGWLAQVDAQVARMVCSLALNVVAYGKYLVVLCVNMGLCW